MIADDGFDLGATSLLLERRELLAAIELVAVGASPRVIVAGLAHAAELVTRLAPRASVAGVVVSRLAGDGPAESVLIRRRPAVVA